MEQVNQTFPFKLYQTLEWASDSEFSSALSWSPTGNALVVHEREAVMEHIIPKFFDHKKWRSFTRQLNLWGFKRELRGPKNMEGERYYHPHFNRGKLDELQLIQRAAIKRYPRNRKKQLSSYDSGSGHGLSLSLSRQIAAMTANNQNDDFKIQLQGSNPQPQQKGDTNIAQGAWVLTGLKGKGQANSLPVGVSAPGSGGSPLPLLTAANCFNDMQVQGRMSKNMNVISSYKTSSLPPTTTILSQMMQLQSQMKMTNPQTQMVSPQMLVQQQMQMMGRSQMFQGYPTPTESNWNPSQLNQGMINEQPTSSGMGMATSMSGTNSNIYCMM